MQPPLPSERERERESECVWGGRIYIYIYIYIYPIHKATCTIRTEYFCIVTIAPFSNIRVLISPLARPERKQATETEDLYFHISYL